MKKVICCQISNDLINPRSESKDKSLEYFDALYSKVDGYYRPKDFWEIPLWIARVSASVPEAKLHVVRNVKESIEFLREKKADYVLFSCLDANKKFIRNIITQLSSDQKVILGGYINKEFFLNNLYCKHQVKWFDTLKEGIEFMGFTYKSSFSYKLFQGLKTIPRLVLSTGCLNHCSFCTIEKEIVETSYPEIFEQAICLRELDFKLVYLNDKTYGQAKNHNVLPCLYLFIKSFNPEFQGFIVQTTATQFNKLSSDFIREAHIVFVEIGVESFNDSILKRLHKPSSEFQIRKACNFIFNLNFQGITVSLIPNLMVGLSGKEKYKSEETGSIYELDEIWKESRETYQNTLDFLEDSRKIISHINITLFSIYENTQSFKELDKGMELDRDQGTLEKSWLQGETCHKEFYQKALEFGIEQINKREGE